MPDGSNHPPKQPAAAAENLALWKRLERTDPKATKPFKRSGGFAGTQIDPTWRLKRMTEEFGPVGQGWGWDQVGEPVITHDMVHIAARVWYLPDPKAERTCWTGVQWGGTELLRRRRDGPGEPNDEAFKMAMTDAVGKCLVQLGLAADVHMGLFDDSKYREESEAYFQAKNNPDVQPEAIAKFEQEIKAKLAKVADLEALDELWRNGSAARLREIGAVDRAAQHRIITYFSQKKAELLAQGEDATTAAANKHAVADETDTTERRPPAEQTWQQPRSGQRQPFHTLPLATQAALACKDERFLKWAKAATEEECAIRVRNYCGVASRSELDGNPDAGRRWKELYARYERETRLVAEAH